MKKIFLMLVFGLLLFSVSNAQTAFNTTASNPTGAIANTSTDTLTYTTSRSYELISIQPVVTKTSGTMAGTAVLQESVDGVNFTSTDTLTLTDATTNTTVWNKSTAARYFRILIGGATSVAGTGTAKISAK